MITSKLLDKNNVGGEKNQDINPLTPKKKPVTNNSVKFELFTPDSIKRMNRFTKYGVSKAKQVANRYIKSR